MQEHAEELHSKPKPRCVECGKGHDAVEKRCPHCGADLTQPGARTETVYDGAASEK